jgi:hypothetical protein
MNGSQQVAIDDLSKEDLVRIVQRSENVKRELHGRIGAVIGENIELYAVINELQGALNECNSAAAAATDNGQGTLDGS